MYSLNYMYQGVVSKVIPPTDSASLTKYQYEYEVVVTLDKGVQQIYKCICMDGLFGSPIDFEDRILDQNYRVFVMFPRGQPQLGVIVGGSRKAKIKQKKQGRGPRYLKHFREVEQEITSQGELFLRTLDADEGPTASQIKLTKENLELTSNEDKSTNYIKLDQSTESITIKTGQLEITVQKNSEITISGNAKLTVRGSVNLECEDATVKAKTITAEANTATVKATQSLKIDSMKVVVAGDEGQVLTTMTQPNCYISGAPFVGSKKVFAGS